MGEQMSYCVNCGVKLKEDASVCPLCDCPVINPYEEYKKYSGEKAPAQPLSTDNAPVADWRDLTHFIISLTLALGSVSCCIINVCINRRLTWSLIAVAACITAYICVGLPMKKRNLLPELSVLFDFLSVAFSITVIGWAVNDFAWALRLAYPLSGAVALCAGYIVFLVRRHKIRYFHILALGSVLAGAISVLTELLLNNFTDISWSGISAASCVFFAAVLCIIAKSRRLTRRFHL